MRTGKKFDRRVKLTEKDKKEIKVLYDSNQYSQRKLASKYMVTRRLIQFVLDPEKLIENRKRRAERGGSKIYYDKDKWREVQREHRAYKKHLYEDGKLT